MLLEKIRCLCKKKNMSIAAMMRSANMHSCDFYQAVNGKKPFFPAWRRRISEVLEMPEEELFPEYFTEQQGQAV
jgi:lambda repressor-like predicted transcriptional regulator